MEKNNESQMDNTTFDSSETASSSTDENLIIGLPLFILSFMFYLHNNQIESLPLLSTATTVSILESTIDDHNLNRKSVEQSGNNNMDDTMDLTSSADFNKLDNDSNSSSEITFNKVSKRARSHYLSLSSDSSSSASMPLTERVVKRKAQEEEQLQQEQYNKRMKVIQMDREWHHRQQMKNLQMSAGVLLATTCKAFNSRHQVKVRRLSTNALSKQLNDLPEITRKNNSELVAKEHQTKAKITKTIIGTVPGSASSITFEVLDSKTIHQNVNSIQMNSIRNELIEKLANDIIQIKDIELPSELINNDQAVKHWIIEKSIDCINQHKSNITNSNTND